MDIISLRDRRKNGWGGGEGGEKIQEKGNPLLFLPSLLINTCYAG